MKKIIFPLILISHLSFAQYLIVGSDSISAKDYMRDNKYGLDEVGVDKTINASVDFMLLQQLAKEKKADTLTFFKNAVNQKFGELREKYYYPQTVINPILNEFVDSNKNEIQVLLFFKQKDLNDKTDYKVLYNEVVNGKTKMEDFLFTHGNAELTKPLYLKPGMLNYDLYQKIKSTPVNGITPLVENTNFVAFAKVIGNRPSLGYMIFGALQVPNDTNYESVKKKIYTDLNSGVNFQTVVKTYALTEAEKNNGGAVMGSPVLPDEVYNALKGQPKGYYTPEPILYDGKYFVFNIYNIEPYELKDNNKKFFQNELKSSSYGDELNARFLSQLKSENKFTETKDYLEIKKSYQAFKAFKKPKAVLITYANDKVLFEDFQKIIETQYKDLDKATSAQWQDVLEAVTNQYIMGFYGLTFTSLPNVKSELDETKKNLYSEYVFSEYLKEALKNNPQLYTDYFNQNKDKFVWGKRANTRAAIITDPKLVKEIQKDLKDPSKFNSLKEKYKNQVNNQNLVLVHFEEGKILETADIFKKYNVPFKTGVFLTKIEGRDVVVAVDSLLPEQVMTLEEAKPEMEDAVFEKLLQKTIAEQKSKIKVEIQPAFVEELNKNFKK